jgi:hypothetical protein
VAPKPTSSSSTSTMFGAPGGASTVCGQSGIDLSRDMSILPLNGGGGFGSTSSARAVPT